MSIIQFKRTFVWFFLIHEIQAGKRMNLYGKLKWIYCTSVTLNLETNPQE